MRRVFCFAMCFLSTMAVWAQQPIPVPLQGGDVIPGVNPGDSPFLITIYSPGTGVGFDGSDADPNVITNFSGVAAMGYGSGLATDQSHTAYQIVTDVRVYQGKYVGAVSTYSAGGSGPSESTGTFIEI